MTSPRTGPCEWPIQRVEDCTAVTSLAASGQELVEDLAREYLWEWTGRRFGLCEVSLRPCRTDCAGCSGGTWPYGWWQPVFVNGKAYNLQCGACGAGQCSCTFVNEIVLPGPVSEIVEVKIDGSPMATGAYRVDNYRRLVRTDGDPWPVCQNMDEATTEEDTWEVTYKRGTPVPSGGQVAAGMLSCEMAKALTGDDDCSLPQRLQTITRQGVTVGVIDSFDGLDDGRTGLWHVDSWVASVTQAHVRSGGSVASPDYPPKHRQTTYP